MGYEVRYADGKQVTEQTYSTIEEAEEVAIAVFIKTNKPTVVIDEKYRKDKQ